MASQPLIEVDKEAPRPTATTLYAPAKYVEIVRKMQKLLVKGAMRDLAGMMQEQLTLADRPSLSPLDVEFTLMMRATLAVCFLKLKELSAAKALLSSVQEKNFAFRFLSALCQY